MSFPDRIRKFENFHIYLWLLKDLFWVTLSETAGMIMIVPAVGLAFRITWMSRHYRAELYHNLAVCCWIMANSVWMTGEFFYDDSFRGATTVLFVAGLSFITWYYIRLAVTYARKNKVGAMNAAEKGVSKEKQDVIAETVQAEN